METLVGRGTRYVLRRAFPKAYGRVAFGRYAREWILPRPARPADEPFLPGRMLGHAGIDLHADEQLARVQRWAGSERHRQLFQSLRRDPAINKGIGGRDFGTDALHNGFYPTPDAEIYAAMILDAEPAEVVEVGSGFSTLVARHAIRFGNLKTRLVVIDPEPRTDVGAAADEIVRKPVEESNLSRRQWAAGRSILFIDSSHVCRARGDLPLLFCQVLPPLPAGTLVHVHDIFLPYDYPTNYDPRAYTEQYLLHCLLSGAPRYRTRFANHYMCRTRPEAMQAAFGPLVGRDTFFNGSSYWFEVTADGENAD